MARGILQALDNPPAPKRNPYRHADKKYTPLDEPTAGGDTGVPGITVPPREPTEREKFLAEAERQAAWILWYRMNGLPPPYYPTASADPYKAKET